MNRSLFFKDHGCAKNSLLALVENRLLPSQTARLRKVLERVTSVRQFRSDFADAATSGAKRCPVTVDCAMDKEFVAEGSVSEETARLNYIMDERSDGRAFWLYLSTVLAARHT